MTGRLRELEKRRLELEPELETAAAPAPRLHPNNAEVYRRKVEELHRALRAEDAGPARELIRGLVEAIVLIPDEERLRAEVHGGGAVNTHLCMAIPNTTYYESLVMTNPDGIHAAAEFQVVGKYVGTDTGLPPARGQPYRLPAGAFFEVNDGKVARISNTYNLHDWLKQVVV